MTTKIRATLLTAVFFFGLLTGLQAQDKYEFAIVNNYGSTGLTVITHTTVIQQLPKNADIMGELIKKVGKYITVLHLVALRTYSISVEN
jgi:hypothetical protein